MIPVRLTRLFAAASVALALGACGAGGGSRPIPADDAAFLIAQIEQVEERVAAGDGVSVRNGTFVRLDRAVDRLPENVDGDVRQALVDGIDHLEGLAEDECEAAPPEPAETTPSTPTTTPDVTSTEEQPPAAEEPDQGDEGESPPDTTGPDAAPPTTAPQEAPPGNGQGGQGQGAPGQGNGGTGSPPGVIAPPAGSGGGG